MCVYEADVIPVVAWHVTALDKNLFSELNK